MQEELLAGATSAPKTGTLPRDASGQLMVCGAAVMFFFFFFLIYYYLFIYFLF